MASVIGAGIVPAGLEMMDKLATQRGRGLRARRLRPRGRGDPAGRIRRHARGSRRRDRAHDRGDARQRLPRASRARASEAERLRYWSGRKAAFPAVGRISPDYYCIDGSIPRGALAQVLRRIEELSAQVRPALRQRLPRGRRQPAPADPLRRQHPRRAREDRGASPPSILELCIEVGGTITGEHGVGIEKINQMCTQFRPAELAQFHAVKAAFDPQGLLNPGKTVPDAAPLRGVRRDAREGAARCRFPTCRASDATPSSRARSRPSGRRRPCSPTRRACSPFETDAFIVRRAAADARRAARHRSAGARRGRAPAASAACRSSRAARAPASRAARFRTREGVLLVITRLRSILALDPLARTATVEPGVRNLAVSEARRAARPLLRARSRRASRCARSAATSRRTPAACIASSTASRRTTSSRLRAFDGDGRAHRAGIGRARRARLRPAGADRPAARATSA